MKQIQTAVILAAGKSTRTYPITLDTPKALLKVANQSIIERTLDELHGLVRHVIIVVNYKQEMIRAHLGNKYRGIQIEYAEQPEPNGTGGAVLLLRKKLQGRFLVLNGDDLYQHDDIARLLTHPLAVLAQKVSNPDRFGVFTINKKDQLTGLVEKPKKFIGNLVNTGCYLLDDRIFEYELTPSPRGEYELTDYLLYAAKQYGVYVVQVQKYWLALGYSWDLLQANYFILEHDFGSIQNTTRVPKEVTLVGPVRLGKNVRLGKGVRIFGPVVIGDNVQIGDSSYILPYTVIENNVVIEAECMVAESLVMDGSVLHRDGKRRGTIVTPKYTISLN